TRDAAGNAASGAFTVAVSAPTSNAAMIGSGQINGPNVEHAFSFVVREHASGAEAGAIQYTRETRPSGRGLPTVDRFVSMQVTSVAFYDAPGSQPTPAPPPTLDQVTFTGVGAWNGHGGYTFAAQALDAGDPGRGRDQFSITIRDAGGAVVATVTGTIGSGSIQSL